MSNIDLKTASDREILDLLESDRLCAKVRKMFVHKMAEIEQRESQNQITPVQVRREELILAQTIVDVVEEDCWSGEGIDEDSEDWEDD